MESLYDETFDIKKKHSTSREEQNSTIMARLHAVPKKIADAAQTQGVSEKFLSNGLPSGIINPSMLAHDRFLSAMDGIYDAVVTSSILIFLPLLPLNLFTISIIVLSSLYWFFHIAWWEKTKIWAIKSSAKKYLKNTYNYYWIFLYLFIVLCSGLIWYFVFSKEIGNYAVDAINFVLEIFSKGEQGIANTFSYNEVIREHFSTAAMYKINFSTSLYEYKFIAAVVIFSTITLISKNIFSYLYTSEKNENKSFSKEEMQYAGEAALETLMKEKNA